MSESEGNTSVDQLIKTAPVDSSVFHDEMLTLNQLKFGPQLKAFKIHSDKLDLDFSAYIQDETNPLQQRCYIMTIHDLGCDHTSFQEFIECSEMRALKDRIIWIHVDLPGQESNATDLNITKYPALTDIAGELINVLDHFNIGQITCFGEGVGANIAARFAMAHPNRCMGIILIHPTGSSASFFETMKDKISNILPSKNNTISSSMDAYLIWHRYGQKSDQSDQLIQANIKEFRDKLYGQRNKNNLSLLMDVFLHRTNLTEKASEIKCDVLTAFGKKGSLGSETRKFFKALNESRKENPKELVNCPLVEIDDAADVMGEAPDRLAMSLQFFLQGIGLLPAMPMRKSLTGLGRLSRSFSMEEADRPRRISFNDQIKIEQRLN